MSASTIPAGFLFHYEFPVPHLAKPPKSVHALEFPPESLLADLSELTGHPNFADVQLAWHSEGLALCFQVHRDRRSGHSSGISADTIRIWIDTRNTKNVHRATRFCHLFVLSPLGSSPRSSQPTAQQALIASAREDAPRIDDDQIALDVTTTDDSYTVRCWLSKQILHGYDPENQSLLGFYYELEDRFCGRQCLLVGPEFPYDFDPSLWQTLRLN